MAAYRRSTKAAYRRSNVARLIMSRVHVRPRTDRCPWFDLAAVQAVLEAFGCKSVWSGATDDLTIVRIDRSKPLGVGNAMVVQVREANRHVPPTILARAKRLAARGSGECVMPSAPRSLGALV
jgi:hypothetical protein